MLIVRKPIFLVPPVCLVGLVISVICANELPAELLIPPLAVLLLALSPLASLLHRKIPRLSHSSDIVLHVLLYAYVLAATVWFAYAYIPAIVFSISGKNPSWSPFVFICVQQSFYFGIHAFKLTSESIRNIDHLR